MTEHSDSAERWPQRLRWLAAIFFAVAGGMHFFDPDFYRQIVPPGFPDPGLLVGISGACEIAGGLALLIRPLRRWAGWGLIALLIAVFPANIYMAVAPHAIEGLDAPTWLLWLRLPFQAVFMAWIWFATLRRPAACESNFPRLATLEPLHAAQTSGLPHATRFRPLDKLMLAATVIYGTALLLGWTLLHYAADGHWWATVLLFAPRWIWAIPLAPLTIAACLLRRRLWLVCLIFLALGAVDLSDVHCPWRRLLEPATTEPHLRVLTCNCDSWALHPDALGRVVAQFDPDIVALQDVEPAQVPKILAGSRRSWNVDIHDGLALASRYPIRAIEARDDPILSRHPARMRRYELDVDGTSVQFFNIHLLSPRWGLRAVQTVWWRGASMLQEASDGRRQQAETASRWIGGRQNIVMAGDFNTPPESPVYRENFGRLSSAFAVAGWGVGSTYFAQWFSLRLDHILCGADWQPKHCWVGPNVGSEHHPLMAVLARTRRDGADPP